MKKWLLDLFHLTKRQYFADFFITPPLTIILAIVSLRESFSVWWFAWFAAGGLAWTFYEYVLHRWVSHELPFFRDVHALHHDHQKDYIAVHPAVTLIIYCTFWLIFGFRSSSFMVGFSVGYIIYSILHTAFHYARIGPGGFLFAAARRHALHHSRSSVNFGVSTALWDVIFRTHL